MRSNLRLFFFLLLLACGQQLRAQDLSFLGLDGIKFGMHVDSLKQKVVVIDSTTSYKDTAAFIRNTHCVIWFKKDQQLQLKGFVASRVEYEFCDKHLNYVFIKAKGHDNIGKALLLLQNNFPNASFGTGGNAKADCSNRHMRMIATITENGEALSLVLIPKKLKY